MGLTGTQMAVVIVVALALLIRQEESKKKQDAFCPTNLTSFINRQS